MHLPTDFEQFYIELGMIPVPTVADGNCCLDVMVQSRKLARTPDEMQNMRNRLADYLMANAGNACLFLTLRDMGYLEPNPGAAPLPADAGSNNAYDAPAPAVAGSHASCANDPSAHVDGGPDAAAVCACVYSEWLLLSGGGRALSAVARRLTVAASFVRRGAMGV